MFKKSLQNNKVVRVVAIVLTVAMLMTVCMTEAFAEQLQPRWNTASRSGTFLGLPVFTEVYISRPEARIYASCGYMAGITLDLNASFSDPNRWWEGAEYRSGCNTYCNYEATMVVRHEESRRTAVDDLQGKTTIGYNGATWGPYNTSYYVGGNA